MYSRFKQEQFSEPSRMGESGFIKSMKITESLQKILPVIVKLIDVKKGI